MSSDFTRGRWKEGETEILKRLVREHLKADRNADIVELAKRVTRDKITLPWSAISKKMGRRSRLSCFKKWQKMTTVEAGSAELGGKANKSAGLSHQPSPFDQASAVATDILPANPPTAMTTSKPTAGPAGPTTPEEPLHNTNSGMDAFLSTTARTSSSSSMISTASPYTRQDEQDAAMILTAHHAASFATTSQTIGDDASVIVSLRQSSSLSSVAPSPYASSTGALSSVTLPSYTDSSTPATSTNTAVMPESVDASAWKQTVTPSSPKNDKTIALSSSKSNISKVVKDEATVEKEEEEETNGEAAAKIAETLVEAVNLPPAGTLASAVTTIPSLSSLV